MQRSLGSAGSSQPSFDHWLVPCQCLNQDLPSDTANISGIREKRYARLLVAEHEAHLGGPAGNLSGSAPGTGQRRIQEIAASAVLQDRAYPALIAYVALSSAKAAGSSAKSGFQQGTS